MVENLTLPVLTIVNNTCTRLLSLSTLMHFALTTSGHNEEVNY